MQGNPFWCFCGRVAQERFNGKCERHAKKEVPKKKEKQVRFRGKSSWAKNEGMFDGVKEN